MAGKVAGADPEAFKVIDGKLYLNWNEKASKEFEANAAENIRKADINWKNITEK